VWLSGLPTADAGGHLEGQGVEESVMNDAKELLGVIRRIRLDSRRHISEVLSGTGVTVAQHAVLSMLAETGETNMGSLARSVGTTMGAVTSLVDKLVYAGYVTRSRSVDDRRVVNVKITPQGREVVERCCEVWTRSLARFFDGVGATERRKIIDTHHKLADFLHEASSGATSNSEQER